MTTAVLEMPSEAEIDRRVAVGPQIHAALRARIIRNDLHPAARVSESELAAAYGISRQPIREAFIKLAAEGLVEVRPQRGTFITKISQDAVMDACFVREAVEVDIVRALATDRSDALMAELDAQLVEQRARRESRPDDFNPLDERFHHTMAEACGNGHLWRLVQGVKAQMDRVRHLNLIHNQPMVELVAEHEAIVAAIGDRDADAAEAATRFHLRQIVEHLPGIVALWPDYFETTAGPNAR